MNIPRKKIGEMLIEKKIIDNDKLQKGLKHQGKTGMLLGECLVELGFVNEEALTQTLAEQFGIPFISLKNYSFDSTLIAKLPEEFIMANHILPLDKIGNITTVVAADMVDEEKAKELEGLFKGKVKFYLTTVSDLKSAMEKIFSKEKE